MEGIRLKYNEHEQTLLKEWVTNQEASQMGRKTTVVCLQLNNGYEVLGTSACLNPEEYDYEAGIYYATKDALKKVEEIVGYLAHQSEAFF